MEEDPKFQVIADGLRAAIAEGRYQDKRLPGEDALAAEYGVSRTTVRTAIAALVAEGLLETRRRSGTYVRTYRRILRDANQRLATAQWGSGRDIWDVDAAGRERSVDMLEVFPADAPADVAQRLATERVWVRRRRYLIDSRPIQVATSYLPAAAVEGSAITTPDTGAGGTYARLAELGFAPVEFVERQIVRMPTGAELAQLELGPATPVAQIRREAITAKGRIIEVNDMVCAGDAYIFQWRFPAA